MAAGHLGRGGGDGRRCRLGGGGGSATGEGDRWGFAAATKFTLHSPPPATLTTHADRLLPRLQLVHKL